MWNCDEAVAFGRATGQADRSAQRLGDGRPPLNVALVHPRTTLADNTPMNVSDVSPASALRTPILAGAAARLVSSDIGIGRSPRRPTQRPRPALGEKYRLEIARTRGGSRVWSAAISSDRLDLIGSRVDLVDDLGFGAAAVQGSPVRRCGRRASTRSASSTRRSSTRRPACSHATVDVRRRDVFDAALPVDSDARLEGVADRL